jgi:hypothetical protein
VKIAQDHIDESAKIGSSIEKDKHYFQIRINEMYLANEREWFKKYDPMVLIISEFIYGKKTETVPSVIGPMMMGKFKENLPSGTIFSDIQVAGPHPYKGGSLTLTVVLSRLIVANYLRRFLKIVESAASILNLSTSFDASLKLADVVLDGVDAILESKNTQPIIALHKDFAVDGLEPGYFALIDADETLLNVDTLWVRERRLLHGKSLADAQPLRGADYVLYSIVPTQPPDRRGNLSTLPFYPEWEKTVEEASKPTKEDWNRAKGHLFSLYQSMALSPDLVEDEADTQFSDWRAKAEKKHNDAKLLSDLGPTEAKPPTKSDKIRRTEAEILDL